MRKEHGDGAFTARVAQEAEEEHRRRKAEERAARSSGAHTTRPIKDAAMVEKWFTIAKEHDRRRARGGVSWYMLVLLGFNTGLRIGDLCKLKVRDVRGRERVRIIAEKTGKMTDIMLTLPARKAIDAALQDRDGGEWALESRQRGRKTGQRKPISRQRCYGIIKEIAAEAGYEEHAGCHTMRKTFAWGFYETCGDLAKLQKMLNHSSQEATLHYLGLDQMALDEVIRKMRVFV